MSRTQPVTSNAPLRFLGLEPPHPDHHLWRNGRVWWAAFTVHGPDGSPQRIRTSLRTADLSLARRRRDALLQRAAGLPGWRLALRFVPREGGVGPEPVATS
jgi:hypothetical protein